MALSCEADGSSAYCNGSNENSPILPASDSAICFTAENKRSRIFVPGQPV